jgi:5-hydroxyisourate hydrolase
MRISTHVLNTKDGIPGVGIPVTLHNQTLLTNEKGRCEFITDQTHIELIFDIQSYFPDSLYPKIVIACQLKEGEEHYHLPLLVTPFSYSTYRGT